MRKNPNLRSLTFAVGTLILGLQAADQAAHAETYGFAGCGVGTRIFGPRDMQTSASTTNHGSIPVAQGLPGVPTSQPWSITFDLAGCEGSAKPVSYFEQYNYMYANFPSLEKETAQGQGPALDGFARLVGCGEADTPAFRSFMKQNYASIFSQPGVQASFEEFHTLIEQDQDMIAACPLINDDADKAPSDSDAKPAKIASNLKI